MVGLAARLRDVGLALLLLKFQDNADVAGDVGLVRDQTLLALEVAAVEDDDVAGTDVVPTGEEVASRLVEDEVTEGRARRRGGGVRYVEDLSDKAERGAVLELQAKGERSASRRI